MSGIVLPALISTDSIPLALIIIILSLIVFLSFKASSFIFTLFYTKHKTYKRRK